MKYGVKIILVLLMLPACSDPQHNKLRDEVIATVEKYASEQIEFPQRSVDRDGVIAIYNNGIVYRIDPKQTIFGEIDGSPPDDAIVTVAVSRMPIIGINEHIVLINKDDEYVVSSVLDSGLRILSIENGIISVETSVVSPDSPMYGCESCMEVVHYRYSDGKLVRAD